MAFTKSSFVFITVCVALAMANTQVLNKLPANLNFLDFMSSSTDSMQANPDQSMACFSYYIPIINEIAQTYAAELSNCTNVATAAELNAEAATLAVRTSYASAVNASCAALTLCPKASTVEDVFQCYITQGVDQSKEFYTISTNATMQLTDLVEMINNIKSQQDICNTQAEVKYEQDSAVAYGNLNSCILGNSAVPTTAAPTTTTTASSSSAAPVSSSSSAPTTAAPVDEPTTVA
ncbi:uncharacterized protein LOC101890866 [Musca domestica]|uniref:Probable beta-glucosidase btgE n=1 Tax=Musca domestica TaxID=7370 RepID=A0A1I8NEM7_MUSDO|nr:uncharacterized protein LOC101890866 [Musca domestica]